ncbi:hypothetical protein GXM_04883 [Nostoc sphaeroides CCNUC1]|uniref:Uncharacterized protein n=1 Tax=Nostoc sphaeroides CCNUC1 TaxID=2653204 RepID=A0A5P8W4F7_9NOSO|nr:hypothetical protein GXM_04883 [Nostoc sphaeroides CCNUC1]
MTSSGINRVYTLAGGLLRGNSVENTFINPTVSDRSIQIDIH